MNKKLKSRNILLILLVVDTILGFASIIWCVIDYHLWLLFLVAFFACFQYVILWQLKKKDKKLLKILNNIRNKVEA